MSYSSALRCLKNNMTYINPRQKVLWHTDRLHELRTTGTTSAPVNVEIDLSNRCSHGCRWCRFAYTHTRGPLAGTEKPGRVSSVSPMILQTAVSLRLCSSARERRSRRGSASKKVLAA